MDSGEDDHATPSSRQPPEPTKDSRKDPNQDQNPILPTLHDESGLADLSAVTHIDSSGVASILEAYQMAKQNGTRFALAGVNQQVMRMLELTRLDQALSIHESGTYGLNELSQTRPQVRFGPRRNQRGSGCAPVPVR